MQYSDTMDRWSMVIKNGKSFVQRGDSLQEICPDYLNQPWFTKADGNWEVLETLPTRLCFLGAMHYLATALLPWWEAVIHPNYTKTVRKRWSHHGIVRGKGDMGNKLYYQVIQTAIAMRKQYNYVDLETLPYLNPESAGDVLEAILGLDALGHIPMEKQRRCIEAACIGVEHFWTNSLPHEWNTVRISLALLSQSHMYVELHPSEEQQEKHHRHQAHLARVDHKNVLRLVLVRCLPVGLQSIVQAFVLN